jgi:hypothetical protein
MEPISGASTAVIMVERLPHSVHGGALGLATFASDGAYVWGKLFEANSPNSADLTIDAAGNILLTGMFVAPADGSSLDFGGGLLPHADWPDVDGDLFLAKLDPQGEHVWSSSFPAPLTQGANSRITTATDGAVFVTGGFKGELPFGATTLNAGNEPGGNGDIFLAAFSSDGQSLWSASFGDEEEQSGTSLAVVGNQVFLFGSFGGTMMFPTQTLSASVYLGGDFHERRCDDRRERF